MNRLRLASSVALVLAVVAPSTRVSAQSIFDLPGPSEAPRTLDVDPEATEFESVWDEDVPAELSPDADPQPLDPVDVSPDTVPPIPAPPLPSDDGPSAPIEVYDPHQCPVYGLSSVWPPHAAPQSNHEFSDPWCRAMPPCGHPLCGVHYCEGRFCPVVWLGADHLYWTRDNQSNGMNLANGPGGTGFGDLGDDYRSGYRVKGGFDLGFCGCDRWTIEAAYTQLDGWSSTQSGMLNGVAFDAGANAGNPFAGRNFIDQTTLFAPINAAATSAGANDEFDGLGPNNAFADAPPTFTMTYESELEMFEVLLKHGTADGRYEFGLGFASVDLNELATAGLTGRFRAADIAAPSGGLSNADMLAGGLTLLSGPGNGFDDESAAGGPDLLAFSHSSRTTNQLNGFLAQFEGTLYDRGRYSLVGHLKGGAFHNSAAGTIVERYAESTADGSVYGRAFTDSRDTVAFVGGVGVNGVARVTNHVYLRAGYEVLFISGVALAPNQAGAIQGGTYQVDTDGSVIVHGGNAGVEVRF